MEPEPLNQTELYESLRDWVAPRLSWFPRWTFEDILHEAFIVALEKLDGFDPQKGSRWSYLNPRLFEPLWRKYMHLEGYRIDRQRVAGKWMRRKAVKVVTLLPRLPDPVQPPNEPQDIRIPDWSNPERDDTASLVMRGLRPMHVAAARGVTQAAVSSIFARMRREWLKAHKDRP